MCAGFLRKRPAVHTNLPGHRSSCVQLWILIDIIWQSHSLAFQCKDCVIISHLLGGFCLLPFINIPLGKLEKFLGCLFFIYEKATARLLFNAPPWILSIGTNYTWPRQAARYNLLFEAVGSITYIWPDITKLDGPISAKRGGECPSTVTLYEVCIILASCYLVL